jgi:hypothetical protein
MASVLSTSDAYKPSRLHYFETGSKGGVRPGDGETSGFWPLGGKWMAFMVRTVGDGACPLHFGRQFGKIEF